ncbi:unnamed protein product [Polarella glacialis]|uniref:Uncharacterized protein n=1 Tax=Polarella glacialis TaxID=89957 RepID=A0A813I1Z0_POLGL|nr:unnamed protein product [Polarella glacialis]
MPGLPLPARQAHWQQTKACFEELLRQFRGQPWDHWLEEFMQSLSLTAWSEELRPDLNFCLGVAESESEKSHLRRASDSHPRFFLPTREPMFEAACEMVPAIRSLPRSMREVILEEVRRRSCSLSEGALEGALVSTVLLPWLICCEDTLHVYRFFSRMQQLAEMQAPSAEAVKGILAEYAGVACGLVESGALLRRAVPKAADSLRLLTVDPTRGGYDGGRSLFAVRSMWVEPDFDFVSWSWQYKPTSFSLEANGAIYVLTIHKCARRPTATTPCFLICPVGKVLQLGLPVRRLFPDAAWAETDSESLEEGKGKEQEDAGDSNFAAIEQEVVVPPFTRFSLLETEEVPKQFRSAEGDEIMKSPSAILRPELLCKVLDAWGIRSEVDRTAHASELRRVSANLHWMRNWTGKDGSRSFTDSELAATKVVLLAGLEGSWCDAEKSEVVGEDTVTPHDIEADLQELAAREAQTSGRYLRTSDQVSAALRSSNGASTAGCEATPAAQTNCPACPIHSEPPPLRPHSSAAFTKPGCRPHLLDLVAASEAADLAPSAAVKAAVASAEAGTAASSLEASPTLLPGKRRRLQWRQQTLEELLVRNSKK